MTITSSEPQASRARRYAVLGVLAVAVLLIVAFLRTETAALTDVIGYHLRRPILTVKAESSWVSLGLYDALEVRSIDSVPHLVRARLDSILDARVGPDFRRRLVFVHSVYADHSDSTFQAETGEARWRRFEYRVGYAWLAPTAGVLGYIGYIELYPHPHRTATVQFPAIARQPALGNLIPLSVARDSAEAHGVRPISARLEYDARRGRMQYQLIGIGRDLGGSGTNPVAIIDAHSGRVVLITQFDWIS